MEVRMNCVETGVRGKCTLERCEGRVSGGERVREVWDEGKGKSIVRKGGCKRSVGERKGARDGSGRTVPGEERKEVRACGVHVPEKGVRRRLKVKGEDE